MLHIALVGCGGHATAAHAPALAHYVSEHRGEVELVAACDVEIDRARRFCSEYGFARAYADMEAMISAETPDAVVCTVPVEKIAEASSGLLTRGIPCVVEKPLGGSREESRRLIDVARSSGTPHMVSVNRRFSPYLRRAVEWARETGPLHYVRGQMFRHARLEKEFIWGTAIHVVDAMRYIGGDVESFDAPIIGQGSESVRSFVISVRFASGCQGYIEVLPNTGMAEETYELFGDGFRAAATTMGLRGESVRCWKAGRLEVDERANPADPPFLRDGSYEETCAFIRSLKAGAQPRPTITDIAPSMEICWQIAWKMETA